MDRRWSLAARALGAGLALGLAAAAPVPAPPLREMRWIASALPRADTLRMLTSHPAECLTPTADPAVAAQIAVGRAMFSAPLLLGGQAARAGISCAACHVAGRGNPQFAFPGVSGPAGTADVTSSLFSSRRGDGVFNPRPIPDLAIDSPKISRDPADPALRRFIHALVVEEFDGLEPPPRILDGLVAYIRALRGTCVGTIARSGAGDADNAMAAISAARAALAEGDAASARLLVGAARSTLGRIDERFAGNPGIARRLARHDDELRRLRAMAVQDPGATRRGLARWVTGFARDAAALRAAEPASLYVAAVLDKHWPTAGPAVPPKDVAP
jgi:hypothetical protein